MASEEGGGSALTSTFNAARKVWHLHHYVMMFSMLGFGVASLVASGGTFGFLDLAKSYLGMVVEGIPELLEHGGEFVEVASSQAGEGVWYTGVDVDHGVMHGGGAAAEFSNAASGHSAHEQVAQLSSQDEAQVLQAADDRGLDRGQLLELMQSHDR
ncbi:MAG: hypothetical protein GC137_03945 [Alphaproteobacteria bacterium]|nr:hypothetical protein [Alphaproteobacteria bacterium]